MENHKLIIVIIFILNQIYKTIQVNDIVPPMLQYKSISDLRQQISIVKERRTCIEICNECFNDVILTLIKCV